MCFVPVKSGTKNIMCKKCNSIMYCSKWCKKKCESIHDKMCDPLILENPLSIVGLYFACDLHLKRNEKAFRRIKFGEPTDMFFHTLNDFVELISKKFPKIPRSEIEYVTKMMHFLSYTFMTTIGGYITGHGLFNDCMMIDHSCNPNCYSYSVGNVLYVKALRDIKSGEKITISYDQDLIYVSWPMRQESLENILGQKCYCSRCTDFGYRIQVDAKFDERISKQIPAKIGIYLQQLELPSKSLCNYQQMIKFSKTYKRFFPIQNTISYLLFKQYGANLWETYRFRDSEKFMEDLQRSCTMWKEMGIHDTRRLEQWIKIMNFLNGVGALLYQQDCKLNLSNINTNVAKDEDIGLKMKNYVNAIETWFDVKMLDIEILLYPCLKLIIDMVDDYKK
jgi:hypothetical protein